MASLQDRTFAIKKCLCLQAKKQWEGFGNFVPRDTTLLSEVLFGGPPRLSAEPEQDQGRDLADHRGAPRPQR